MNREIKFRGKRIDNGEWIYGNLKRDTYDKNDYEAGEFYEIDGYAVDENTIGQFTRAYDCNGKEVYEDDIVNFESTIYKVRWVNGYASVVHRSKNWIFEHIEDKAVSEKIAIVGNIHDNPELLNSENNGSNNN